VILSPFAKTKPGIMPAHINTIPKQTLRFTFFSSDLSNCRAYLE
jgi:hypothetical protein